MSQCRRQLTPAQPIYIYDLYVGGRLGVAGGVSVAFVYGGISDSGLIGVGVARL